MNTKSIIYIIILWLMIKIADHYIVPCIFILFSTIGSFIVLFVLTIIHIIKLIKNRKSVNKIKYLTIFVFITMLVLDNYPWIINRFIEKIDWGLLYSTRKNIVEEVRENKLNPNVSWNDILCELPYEFPIVSNGGNDICIYRYNDNTVTVTFYIFRNLFMAPSTEIVYTDNAIVIDNLEAIIKQHKDDNWKIKDNWYRIRDKDVDYIFYNDL